MGDTDVKGVSHLRYGRCPGAEGWTFNSSHVKERWVREGGCLINSNPGFEMLSVSSSGASQVKERKEKKREESEFTQSSLTLCDPMDCSLPGFSVHWIFQARVPEWVPISFSRGSSQPTDRTQLSGKEFCQCRRLKTCKYDPWGGKIPWRRAWQPTPVFWPGEPHGQRRLEGYSPWGRTELDRAEQQQQPWRTSGCRSQGRK